MTVGVVVMPERAIHNYKKQVIKCIENATYCKTTATGKQHDRTDAPLPQGTTQFLDARGSRQEELGPQKGSYPAAVAKSWKIVK